MGFKANEHKDKGMDFSPMPAGEYTLSLVKAERKESTTPGNYYQNCQFSVIGGEYKKRIIFEKLNLQNSNEVAQNIAQGQLAGLMGAIGVEEIDDVWNLTPLMNKPFKAKVKIVTDKTGQYDPKNEIKSFIPADGTTSSEPASATPPWEEGEKKKDKKKKKKDKKKKKNKKGADDVPF